MIRKIWFVTGIGRGLGHAITQAALARGDAVIGTTRDGIAPADLTGDLTMFALDMRQLDAVADVAARAAAVHGRLDVIVNNAGYGLVGPVEAAEDDETAEMFRVNLFAPLAVIRAVLPTLRAERAGHIVNISSVAGIAPGAASGVYSASKAALGALSQSLAQEVAPLGIWVTTVSPGSFRTDFLSDRSAKRSEAEIADYAAGGTVATLLAKDGRQTGNPAAAAQAILLAVDADEPPLDLLLGSDALQRARTRLDRFDEDVRRWEDVSLTTDFSA